MGKKRKESRPGLSSLELAVMDVVWELGDCTSAQVTDEFRKRRPLAPTTIRTVLTNLRNKGYIEPLPTTGRVLLLRPAVPRVSVARRSLRKLLASLFRGQPKQAIAFLLDDSDMDDRDLDEIRRMIDSHQAKNKGDAK
jgi:predicted transcriptional regulator